MATQLEEQQAAEFLKRAEIRTMKKDLRKLREADALKERDKIAKIKTLEEQLEERRPAATLQKPDLGSKENMAGLKKVLEANVDQERIAEKDLKNYATEEERQKIFLLESQRLDFEKQIDLIDKEKDPALKLEKNKLLLRKRDQQAKLNSILEQEKKLEGEQKIIIEKEQTSSIAKERKALEQSRWDLDKKIQDIEKKRWEIEKQMQNIDSQISQADKSSESLAVEKNSLKDKVLGIDKTLREIYSGVMAREEEKRRGLAQEQLARKQALEKARREQKEKIQRQQWTQPGSLGQAPLTPSMRARPEIPVPVKKKVSKVDVQAEEELSKQ